MAYLKKERVKEILDNAPPDIDRKTLLKQMAQSHTIEGYNDQQPTVTDKPGYEGSMLSQALKPITGDEVMGNRTMAGQIINGLGAVGRVGKMAASGWEQMGGLVGPKTGKVAGGLARAILPQDKLSAAAAIAGAASEAETALAARTTELSTEVARTRVLQPSKAQRAAGSLISTTTSIPERYASAVVADPSILSSETPTVAQVSQEYSDMFKKMGEKFDTKLAQKYLNKNYIPGETEAQTLNKNVFKVISKLEDAALAKNVTPAEAFLARSQAATLQRSTLAARNPTVMSYAKGAQNALDLFLENNGSPEIKDLSAKYFRAIAKEQFEAFLPRNKNMSPNALRGMVALKLFAESAGNALTGKLPEAAGKAAQGLAMSPLAVGSALRGAEFVTKSPGANYLAAKQALDWMRNQNP